MTVQELIDELTRADAPTVYITYDPEDGSPEWRIEAVTVVRQAGRTVSVKLSTGEDLDA